MNKQKINGASWCEDAGLFFQLWQMLLLVVGAYQPFTEPPDMLHKAFLVARSGFGLERFCIGFVQSFEPKTF